MNLLVKQEDAQRVLAYLISRPYGEVYQLIPTFTNLIPGVPMNEHVVRATVEDVQRAADVAEARKNAAAIHDHTT